MSDGDIVQVTPDEIIYRASALGSCTRALVAARFGFAALPPPPKLDKAFKQGHALERAILTRMEDKGWQSEPGSDQHEVRLHVGTLDSGHKLFVVGHVDRLMFPPNERHWLPVDAKAFAQSTWDDWERLGIHGFPHYSWQQSVYAEGTGCRRFCLAIYNKDTGEQVEQILSQVHDYSEIQQRVYEIEELVDNKTALTDIPCTNRFGCPYAFLHDPKPIDTIPDDLLTMVENYRTAKDKEESWQNIRKVLGDSILAKLPYNEDTRTFTGSGLTVSVRSKQRHLDMKKIRQLFHDAEVDIDDFYTPGEGEYLVITEGKTSGRKEGTGS